MRQLAIVIASFVILPFVWASETVSLQFFSGQDMFEAIPASGSGTYTQGQKNQLDIQFTGLKLRQTYDIGCFRSGLPPKITKENVCPGVDWSQYRFQSDNNGEGTVGISFDFPLPESTDELYTVIGLVYDGKAQLLSILPQREVIPTPTEPKKIMSARAGFIALALLVVGGLAASWWLVKRRMNGENFTP